MPGGLDTEPALILLACPALPGRDEVIALDVEREALVLCVRSALPADTLSLARRDDRLSKSEGILKLALVSNTAEGDGPDWLVSLNWPEGTDRVSGMLTDTIGSVKLTDTKDTKDTTVLLSSCPPPAAEVRLEASRRCVNISPG